MQSGSQLRLGFYGDDFTGSTDALEALTRAGLRTVLLVGRPRPEVLVRYGRLDAVGIAGCSRSLPPDEMALELRDAFKAIRSLTPRIVHYKVCSTFDSSPEIGSIGRAIEIGAEVFGTRTVPLQVGAPVLGRYCVFGHLFARSGGDSDIFRLDRHPTMSRHPTTPMNESDLRLHLGRQTNRRIELLDVVSLGDFASASARYQCLKNQGAEVVLIDIVSPGQEPIIGQLIDAQASLSAPLFVAGSSGVEYSLSAWWRQEKSLPAAPHWKAPPVAGSVLVISGSCSPVTQRQIEHALNQGAIGVPVKTPELAAHSSARAEIAAVVDRVLNLSRMYSTVIVHTAIGPDDPRRDATLERLGQGARMRVAPVLGGALGQILREVLAHRMFDRIVVAGGDTSWFVARGVGIDALEMIAPLAPGAPLCRASASDSPIDGASICFKGGQVGKDDFLVMAAPSKTSRNIGELAST